MRVRIGSSSIGGRVNIKSKLPSGYQEVEYLESSGTQRIDTGINASSVLGLKYKMRESSGRFGVLGADDYKRHHTYTDSGSLYGFFSIAYGSSSWGSDTEVSVNWLNDRKLYKNGVEVASLWGGTFDTGLTYILFARHNRTQGTYSPYWVGRLYYCKMSVDTDAVRNFIPCVRISDNKPGLYDVVSNEFLVNSGTGEFIVGPNVPSSVIPNIICKPHITIEGTTNLFPSQYQNGYYISGDSSSTLTVSGQYSVPYTVQGKYTLSGYYKIASTDSATNPRITLSATYSDGTTATLKQDWNIVRDGTWRRFSITGATNESKTLTTLKGWLFDYSQPGSARNIACKCVQLENKDHATLYTPTSRPDNTII